MKRANFPHRREQRRKEAEQRQTSYDKLTTGQKIALLEDRGHGHCRQVARLNK